MKITCGIGNIIALILSVKAGNGVVWVLLHFVFGWFYVIYNLIFL